MRFLFVLLMSLFVCGVPLLAVAKDPAPEIFVHQRCGPAPMQAYQLKEYGAVRDRSSKTAAGAKYNAVAQSAGGDVDVQTTSHLEINGETYELPITGSQWLTMYAMYMQCVKDVDLNIDVKQMWQDIMSGKVSKSPEVVMAFLKEVDTLRNGNAAEWWADMEELNNKYEQFSSDFAIEKLRVDGIIADIQQLKQANELQQASIDSFRQQLVEVFSRLQLLEQQHNADQQQIAELRRAEDALEDGIAKLKNGVESTDQLIDLRAAVAETPITEEEARKLTEEF